MVSSSHNAAFNIAMHPRSPCCTFCNVLKALLVHLCYLNTENTRAIFPTALILFLITTFL